MRDSISESGEDRDNRDKLVPWKLLLFLLAILFRRVFGADGASQAPQTG